MQQPSTTVGAFKDEKQVTLSFPSASIGLLVQTNLLFTETETTVFLTLSKQGI